MALILETLAFQGLTTFYVGLPFGFPQKTEPSLSKCLLEVYFYWEGIYLFITGENQQFPIVPF